MKKNVRDSWDFLSSSHYRLVKEWGFGQPTPLQKKCLPILLRGGNYCVLAPTGSGKTMMYLLAACQSATLQRKAVIVVPVMELAFQVVQMFRPVANRLGYNIVALTGGLDIAHQRKALKSNWQVVVATPGRLAELEGEVDWKRVGLLVLDEYDRLLEDSFAETIQALRERIHPACRRLFFSATAAPEELTSTWNVRNLLQSGKVASVQLREEIYLLMTEKKKKQLLLDILRKSSGYAIVYTGNREKSFHLQGMLMMNEISCRVIHGDMEADERRAVFQDFKDEKFNILISTDITGRGWDIPQVDLVVQMDMPASVRDYVHRRGRAGRLGQEARCLCFAGPDEYGEFMNMQRELKPFPAFAPEYDKFEKWKQKAEIHFKKAGAHSRNPYEKSSADLANGVIYDDFMDDDQ
jgi:superfamily II DNA/RNA helicase